MNKLESNDINYYIKIIDQLVIDCEHSYRLTIDYDLFDLKVQDIFITARSNGISDQEIWKIITEKLPTYLHYFNDKKSRNKSA